MALNAPYLKQIVKVLKLKGKLSLIILMKIELICVIGFVSFFKVVSFN
jgi:hypothetical protein